MIISKQAMQTASMVMPATLMGCSGLYFYYKRSEYLSDPVLKRALMHLEKDQRVLDFCGEKIQPGWLVTRENKAGENWVKY